MPNINCEQKLHTSFRDFIKLKKLEILTLISIFLINKLYLVCITDDFQEGFKKHQFPLHKENRNDSRILTLKTRTYDQPVMKPAHKHTN